MVECQQFVEVEKFVLEGFVVFVGKPVALRKEREAAFDCVEFFDCGSDLEGVVALFRHDLSA